MSIGGSRRLLGAGSVVLATAAGVVGVVMLASPAGAHTADLSAKAECQTDGTYTITYTGDTNRTKLDATVNVTGSTPDGTQITPQSQQVTSPSQFTITQAGVRGDATSASVSVHVVWTDSYNVDATGKIDLPGTCTPPPPQTATTTAPTFANATCTSPTPTYTIPDVKGVDYQVNGKPATPGTHDATPGTSVQVEAVAQQGFQLSGDTHWAFDFTQPPTVCTGTAPSFSAATCASPQASYTIPVTDGIEYWVDGHKVAAGRHDADSGSTVKITAIASDGHALTGTTTWTHTFSGAPLHCVLTSTPTAPSFTNATCSTGASYTIPTTSGVEYTVNGDTVTPGKHTASPGTTVTIKATVKPGHELSGTTTWKHTFPAMPPCALGTGSLANTGPDFPVGKTTLLAGLLALVGGLCLLAGRRPSAPGRHSSVKS